MKYLSVHSGTKLVLILFLLSAVVNSEASTDKTSMEVKSRMLKGENVPVIIILKDQPSLLSVPGENVISLLKDHASVSQGNLAVLLNDEKTRGKADRIKQFWIVNAIAASASPDLIERISMREDIESIELDSELHILEDFTIQVSQQQIDTATPAIKRINTTQVWESGIDGSWINVSVIDTGINPSHPDIAGRVIKWVDYVYGYNFAYDDHGHGTHVAGTVGGNGVAGTTTGVAPNVSLLIAKACSSAGFCNASTITWSIQWSVENRADIISMSLGGPRNPATTAAVNNAISSGVIVIAAAGNSGPGAGTIEFPGGEKNVIAVGAVDSSDVIASFSSRGPITVDTEILTKPDVSAPGVNILSLYYLTSGYTTMSGTSMATPHVSGAAALLLQAAKRNGTILTPSQVKNILENTSVDLGITGKDNTYGAGRINVLAAVNYINTPAPQFGYIPPAPTGLVNTSGNFWINYSWQAGSGNITNSYNVSLNGTWTNGSSQTSRNSTVSPHGTSTIIVYAYNNSAGGSLSLTPVTDSKTLPNNPVFITNTSNANVNEGSTISVDYDRTDADGDTATFSTNRTDLFAGFNTATGQGAWVTDFNDAGTYYVNFGVSDGYGSVNNYTMTITVNDVPQPPPFVTDPSASPPEIPDDTDNEPLWGELSRLNVTVTGLRPVVNVTINLSTIGGSTEQPMEYVGGDIWSFATNATAGTSPQTYELRVNATDIDGNSNTSISIPLIVMRNGDVTGDRSVNIADAMLLANYVSYPGSYSISNEFVADVTGDGDLNIVDAMILANYVSYYDIILH